MDDAQRAPGSWQASDGVWYGPEQHPDPSYRAEWSSSATVTGTTGPPPVSPSSDGRIPPPPPRLARPVGGQAGVIDRRPTGGRPDERFVSPASDPSSGGQVRRVLLGALAVVVLVGVGVAAYVLAGGSGDDTAGVTDATVEGGPRTESDDTTASTDDAADEPQVVVIDNGNRNRLGATFPGDWAVTVPGGPTAEELFPDDSAAAVVFDQNLTEQDPNALVFAADRASFDGGVLTSVVASFVTYGDDAGFDSVAGEARPSLERGGGVVEREEDITVGDAPALRVNYRVLTPGEFTGLQVIVDATDGAFVLTFQTDSSGEDAAVLDAIVDSIELD